ncbi:TPA: transposase family protein [Escherichia coli]|nr:transposase family protein [Escherichia coli]
MSIKNDGHYFCRAGGNRPDGLNEPVTNKLLKRQFYADRPNQKWVTDITEFKVDGRKLYLSPIMDLYNGEIVSYNLTERPLASMVKSMLLDAVEQLNKDDKPLLHSDQGWQYQMPRWQRWLSDNGITQSMSDLTQQ